MTQPKQEIFLPKWRKQTDLKNVMSDWKMLMKEKNLENLKTAISYPVFCEKGKNKRQPYSWKYAQGV